MYELVLKMEKLHLILTDVPIHVPRSDNHPCDSKVYHLGPIAQNGSSFRPKQSLD